MLNRDKPVGQRISHGAVFGGPPWSFAPGGMYGIFLDPTHRRAPGSSSTHVLIERHGWFDHVGMPHGRTGDKFARKAMKGTVGLRGARGPFAGWHMSTLKTTKPRKG